MTNSIGASWIGIVFGLGFVLAVIPGLGSNQPNMEYNNAIPLLIDKYLPNGMLGIALTGLMASFMAGVAANVSAFNTVVTTDIVEPYLRRGESDEWYVNFGRYATLGGIGIGIFTALIAGTIVAAALFIGYEAGWIGFGSALDESMWGAGSAFVVDAVVTVLVTLRTEPKPVEQLHGLVYGMANIDESERRAHSWWESPKVLGFTTLAGAAILTIVFW